MDDSSVFNGDNRNEPVVVGSAARKNRAMHFIFDDDDATVLGAMNSQCIARVKLDRLPISGEAGHQIGSPLNRHRPTWEVIAGFENCFFGKHVEIMLAVNQSTQPPQDDFEEWIQGLKDFVVRFLFHKCTFRLWGLGVYYGWAHGLRRRFLWLSCRGSDLHD